MKSKTVRCIDSIRLYTESFGQDSKRACVLIAGMMNVGRFWTDEFCQALASQGWLVIRYDHRDIGSSSSVDWKEFPYTLSDLAADAISILDAYECDAAYFVGHSMGGYICQQIALDFPKRVIGFTAISSGPIGSTAETLVSLSISEKLTLGKTWMVLFCRRDSNDFEEKVNGFIKIWKYLSGSIQFDEDMARAYTTYLLTHNKHAIQAGHNHELVMRKIYATRQNILNLVERIEVPALIIHGEEDPFVLPREGKALAHAIPSSQLVMIPGMGHMMFNRDLETGIAAIIVNHLLKVIS